MVIEEEYNNKMQEYFDRECKIYDDVKRHKISKSEKEVLLKELNSEREAYVYQNNPYRITPPHTELGEVADYFS